MAIDLPQGYYLTNFREMIDYVAAQYADLLSENELDFYRQFASLTRPAQMLYVRMLTRKGVVFRQSKLQYSEIESTAAAAAELQNAGLIDINVRLPVEDFIALFSKPEWFTILQKLPVEPATLTALKSLKRNDFDLVLTEFNLEFDLLSLIDDPLFRLARPEIFETYKLLFFGNLNQDLTEFVLRDLGLFRYENYHIDKQHRLFTSREQIDSYLEYYTLIADLEQVLEQDAADIVNFHCTLPEAHEDQILNRRVQRVNLMLARQLERLEHLSDALDIYERCQLPPARERRARILVKQNKIKSALTLCETIKNQPVDESEAIFADQFGYRTAKKHKIDWRPPENYSPPTESIAIEPGGQGVELDVAEYLSKSGQCFFVENALFLSLFGLHFWDVFFAPVRGAFTNPFQVRPHDLYDEDFRHNRSSLFANLNARVASFNLARDVLINRRREKLGIATPFVHWDLVDEAMIDLALQRIPPLHWQNIFNRLWSDLRANRSGFPDLIRFPDSGGYELIEVKGPGDRLQKNQIRWMQYFAEHQIPHKVIHVEWR